MAVLGDFATLYSDVLAAEGLSKQEILKLIFRLGAKTVGIIALIKKRLKK